jgi:hypothetical protein
MPIDQATATAPTAAVTVTAPAPIKAFDEDDGPSFHDVLDIINPLQHIPIINTIYRHLTGDEEGAVADVGGGALWMGPVGLVGALADLAVKAESGKSIGDNILSWLGLDDDDGASAANEQAAKAAQAQAQQQEAQQTAAVTAPLPAITARALSPLPARQRGDDRKDDRKQDGPAKIGDYLVFGAAGSGQPLSLTPPQPAQQAEAEGPSRQGSYMVFGGSQQPRQQEQQPQQQAAAADPAGVAHQGDYMVFGVPVPAAEPARPVQLAQAAIPALASSPAPSAPSVSAGPRGALPPIGPANVDAVANSVPSGGGPATLSPLPSRSFAVPARRTQVTPNALPQPTTGPAAIPGHGASQALPAMSQGDTNWFVQAVNAGLDKYAAAQKLAEQSTTNAASTAAGAQAAAESFATIH